MTELEALREVAEAARTALASFRHVVFVGHEASCASELAKALAALDATPKPAASAAALETARAWLKENIEGFGYPSTAHKAAALAELLAAQRDAERERCAKVCDARAKWAEDKIETDRDLWANYSNACDDCAEGIREHAQPEPVRRESKEVRKYECRRPARCAEAQTCVGGCGLYNRTGMVHDGR